MGATGSATLNFGAAPGSQFTIATVTGQSGILSTSCAEAFLMIDSTSDNNSMIHQIAPMRFRCGNIVPGTGFDIFAACDWNISNTMTVRWVWV